MLYAMRWKNLIDTFSMEHRIHENISHRIRNPLNKSTMEYRKPEPENDLARASVTVMLEIFVL